MLSRTLGLLQSWLFPWNDCTPKPPSQHRPHKKRKLSATQPVEPLFCPRKTSLEDLNLDVFQLVADQLQQQDASLRGLVSSSRKLRSLAFSRFFARCRVDITKPGPHDPPEAICSHVRHLTHCGPLNQEGDLLRFETLLDQFPLLSSVTLEHSKGRLPWVIFKACLVRSRLVSLTVDLGFYDLAVPVHPQDDIAATPISLQTFTWTTTVWREWVNCKPSYRVPYFHVDMRSKFDFERACITGLILKMCDTVKSLSLPMESAPILAMAEVSWPCLQDLSLHGRFLDVAHVSSLQHLLPVLPSLRNLCIMAGRPWSLGSLGRHPILPKPPTSTSTSSSLLEQLPLTPATVSAEPSSSGIAQEHSEREPSPPPPLSELRSLTIAFPDPDDDLFSLPMHNLTHLSLRDHPRVYHRLAYSYTVPDGPEGRGWAAPLLSQDEALALLQRMDLSNLTSLELAYIAPVAGSDDALLSYIAQAFPKLEHLELHRYRSLAGRDRPLTDRVQHTKIAQLLSAAKTLRTLRLNLDFHEDHQAYCAHLRKREAWLALFRDTLGPTIVEIVAESCPRLEHVALLYHGCHGATWAEFHPQRCAEPRFVLDYMGGHLDSETCIREWETL
ncbi:hypothetical protein V8D89_009887 [Ganoderma adspersum]